MKTLNIGMLFGLLLGYPVCCINHFLYGGGWTTNGDVHYDGYVPCPNCAKLSRSQLMEVIGRDVKNEPDEFREFADSFRAGQTPDIVTGFNIYEKSGKGTFFLDCWNKSLEYR